MMKHPRLILSAALACLLCLSGCGEYSSLIETAEITTDETTTVSETTASAPEMTTSLRETTTAAETTSTTEVTVPQTSVFSQTTPPQTAATQTAATVPQTQPQQTSQTTVTTTAQVLKTVQVREDWCRLMDASDHLEPIVVKDGTGYYFDANHAVAQFDAHDVVQVSSGWNLMLALHSDGSVQCIRAPFRMVSKIEAWRDIVSVRANMGIASGVRRDGTVVCACDSGADPEKWAKVCETVSQWRNVKDLQFDGYYQCSALCNDGTVLVCGYDAYTFDPYVAGLRNVAQVFPAGSFLWVRFTDGRYCSFGQNGFTRNCWNGTAYLDDKTGAVSVSIQNDGTVKYSGTGGIENIGVMTTWRDVAAISSGAQSVIARKTDGTFLLVGEAEAFAPYLN